MGYEIQNLTTKPFLNGFVFSVFLPVLAALVLFCHAARAQEPSDSPSQSADNQTVESQIDSKPADAPLSFAQSDGRLLGVDDPTALGKVPLDHSIERPKFRSGQIVWEGNVTVPDGNVIRQIKTLDEELNVETSYFTFEDEKLTAEAFRTYIDSFTPEKIHRDLKIALRGRANGEFVSVIVTIKAQPNRKFFEGLKGELGGEFSKLAREFKAGDNDARAETQNQYDELTQTIRRNAKTAIQEAQAEKLSSLSGWIEENGGAVGKLATAHAMFSAQIPVELVEQLAEDPEVQCVDLNHQAEANLDTSVPSVGAAFFWGGGYLGGSSGFEPGILDSGLDSSHPALSGLNVLYHIDHYWASRSPNYNDSWTNPNDYHGHGTAITGIIASRGSFSWEDWKGVAPGVARVYNLKSAYRKTNGTSGLFFSDAIDNIDWGIFDSAVDDIDLLNFSYGVSTRSDDNSIARFMDALVDDLDIPVVVAAGNGGPDSYSIVNPANAYNILSVGSMNDIDTVQRFDDVISFSSSRGPTVGGRKKPDITAPGAFIQTLNKDWETEFDFNTWSGSSFAAPHVTGAVLLMMDYFGPPVQPKRIKAVLLNSAGKWGSINWNSTYGWGYLDLQTAWKNRNDSFVRHVSPDGFADDFDLYLANFRPTRDMATLVWNRHVNYASNGNYPNTWYGLNDLDLNLYNHQTGELIDVSASGKDNVEQVSYQPAVETQCVIRVEAEDRSFNAVSQEQYALAGPPGLTFPSSLPQISVSIDAPVRVGAGGIYSIVATLDNAGDINAVAPSVSLSLPTGHSILTGESTQTTTTLCNNSGNAPEVTWIVRAPRKSGFGNIAVEVSSQCWGETWYGAKSRIIVVRSR